MDKYQYSSLSNHRVRKRFLGLFVPLCLAACVAAALLTIHEYRTRKTILEVEQMQILDTEQRYVQQATREVVSDLLVLAGLMDDASLVSDPIAASTAETTRKFLAFARSKPTYDQVRFLDLGGREVIRINNPDGRPTAVAGSRLQLKDHRYYFSSAISLAEGEIYISPLDLNIEHNQVEVPHKPMIRLATPVFNTRGERRGIVVLNYRAENLLRELLLIGHHGDSALTLVNAEGFWLHHPDPAREFGFMFAGRDSLNLTRRYPAVWSVIRDTGRDFLEDKAGFFGFTTVHPIPADLVAHLRTSGDDSIVKPSASYFWKVISFTPRDRFMAHIHSFLWTILLGMGVVLLLLGLASWLLARANEHRRLAEEALLRANDDLENQVTQRTIQLIQTNEDLKREAHEKKLALVARDEAEARLRHQEKLRSLGSATAGVAHDFRNILQPMRGYAQLAMQGVPADSEVAEDLQGVLDAVHRGTELANKLMALGNEKPVALQKVALEDIISEVANQTRTTAPDNIRIHCFIEESCPTILADPGALHQALTNLCRNAVQALGSRGGQIEISARPDTIFLPGKEMHTSETRPAVKLTVRDTGPGIPQRDQSRIFEPYFTTKKGSEGTGLGLCTVYGIVDRHGGTIELDSTEGVGTTFTLQLPMAGPERQKLAST